MIRIEHKDKMYRPGSIVVLSKGCEALMGWDYTWRTVSLHIYPFPSLPVGTVVPLSDGWGAQLTMFGTWGIVKVPAIIAVPPKKRSFMSLDIWNDLVEDIKVSISDVAYKVSRKVSRKLKSRYLIAAIAFLFGVAVGGLFAKVDIFKLLIAWVGL